jgi:hypothetical protein
VKEVSEKGNIKDKDNKLPGSLIALLAFGVFVGISWFWVWNLFLSRG